MATAYNEATDRPEKPVREGGCLCLAVRSGKSAGTTCKGLGGMAMVKGGGGGGGGGGGYDAVVMATVYNGASNRPEQPVSGVCVCSWCVCLCVC